MNAWRFFRHVYEDDGRRRDRRPGLAGDLLRYARGRALLPLEHVLLSRHVVGTEPILFLVGAPRSGTTLLYQLLGRHLDVAYPSNRLARWWMTPLTGAWLLARRTRRATPEIPLRSHLGGTDGDASPHEFAWFWHFHLGFFSSDDPPETERSGVSLEPVARELGALASLFGRPLVVKSISHVDYWIEPLARALPCSRFVHIERDPRFVVQSILDSRRLRYGDEGAWWSVRPREWQRWLHLDPIEQVCRQVLDVTRAVRRGLAALPREAVDTVSYEELVEKPLRAVHRLSHLLGGPACHNAATLAELALRSENRRRLPEERFRRIERCLEELGWTGTASGT